MLGLLEESLMRTGQIQKIICGSLEDLEDISRELQNPTLVDPMFGCTIFVKGNGDGWRDNQLKMHHLIVLLKEQCFRILGLFANPLLGNRPMGIYICWEKEV
jgi:hypothetical protein